MGRRRLAWRPRFPQPAWLDGWSGSHGPFEIILLAIILVLTIGHVLNWLAALLATAVVWPYRTVSGRWLVVAYPLESHPGVDDRGSDRPHQRRVNGHSAATALTHQWARDIEQFGGPREPLHDEASAGLGT
ncbi:hypothetical protein Asi02nite_04860 [Asanoa siamensis]|uniref:Uncharacterized protein n=1 Tax=Asanoa siamensis TaxID=926357 RepID=A0ABQ4CI49_9ACTN|nr:hypothetical protein Asi02nite_04860 [Asanoa siamensis]